MISSDFGQFFANRLLEYHPCPTRTIDVRPQELRWKILIPKGKSFRPKLKTSFYITKRKKKSQENGTKPMNFKIGLDTKK